jgi:arginase
MTNDKIAAALIGVPINVGAENPNISLGPQAFRDAGIVEKLSSAGFEIDDRGNVMCRDRIELARGNSRMHHLDEIVRISEESATLTESALEKGQKVIALGGDHSMNLGVVSGASVALNGKLGLIYLDAHGDMNTVDTTPTGNIHGMHVASLLGFGAPELKNVHGQAVKIAKENFLHIGGSDFDQAELNLIEREKLTAFTLFDLLCQNLSPLCTMINDLAARVPSIWVSLDLDVIDCLYAPAAGMPNAKGLLYREIATIADYIGSRCNVVGVDVVEYNPMQDENMKTAELGIELIARFFGKKYSWYSNYLAAHPVT